MVSFGTLDIGSTELKQKPGHSLPSQVEVMSTSNSKGKFPLNPVGSRFYHEFLIISW